MMSRLGVAVAFSLVFTSVCSPQGKTALSITSISPGQVVAGSASFALTVNGTGFSRSTVIQWNGSALPTTFASKEKITTVVPAQFVATPGVAQVRAANQNGASNPVLFTVADNVADPPAISTLTPGHALAGGVSFVLTVDGNAFGVGATVLWNGSPLPTTFISENRISAAVSAFLIRSAGTADVKVLNPGVSGSMSNGLPFQIAPVVSRFVYVPQPHEGAILKMVIDAASGQATYSGYDKLLPPRGGFWEIHVDRGRRFLYALDVDKGALLPFRIDSASGSLQPVPGSPYPVQKLPNEVTTDPSGRFVYVANYTGNSISAFSVQDDMGRLAPIPGSPFHNPGRPVVPRTDLEGKFLFVTNAEGSSISVYAIDKQTGVITPVPGSPFNSTGIRPWQLAVHPSGKFLYVSNQRSMDVSGYFVDTKTGALTPMPPLPFPGIFPHQIAFDTLGRFAYVVDVRDDTFGVIYGFSVDSNTGQWSQLPGSPFSAPAAHGAYNIELNNAGTLAYVTNYYSWNFDVFAVDASTGALTHLERYATRLSPYGLVLVEGAAPVQFTPEFGFVLDEGNNRLLLHEVDKDTGMLWSLGTSVTTGQAPSSMAVSGPFLYVSNAGSNSLSGFVLDKTSKTLSSIPGGAIFSGVSPKAVVGEASGRFLYAANSGSSTIAAFRIDSATGSLASLGTVSTDRASSLTVDPTGRYLFAASGDHGTLSSFQIDVETGALQPLFTRSSGGQGVKALAMDPLGRFFCAVVMAPAHVRCFTIQAARGDFWSKATLVSGSNPSSILIHPSGKLVYVTDASTSTVTGFVYDDAAGTFAQAGTWAAGSAPQTISVDTSGKFLYVVCSDAISVFAIDTTTGALTSAGGVSVVGTAKGLAIVGSLQ